MKTEIGAVSNDLEAPALPKGQEFQQMPSALVDCIGCVGCIGSENIYIYPIS